MDVLTTALERYPQARFQAAAPFPHLILDGLVSPDLVERLHASVCETAVWDERDDVVEKKRRSLWSSDGDIPEAARDTVRALNSGAALRALSKATGIRHLLSDPYYSGGGFNMIQRGGRLGVHVDGSWHDEMRVHRRLNLILYLNPRWQPDWGGELGFYDEGGRRQVSVAPVPGRVVVFETHDRTLHGHPEPLMCPEGEARTSIILYYYTAQPRPTEHTAHSGPHRALWRDLGMRPKDQIAGVNVGLNS